MTQPLDDSAFDAYAEATLQHLAERIEAALADADIDRQGPVMTITLEDDRQFVLNKHGPTHQLWLASPISGAGHYAWSGTSWLNTRGGGDLTAQLAQDLTAAVGHAVDLD